MPDQTTKTRPPSIKVDQIAALAKALAHPVRVRIVAFLLSKPGCIGGDIVEEAGLAQSTVSEHLRILRDAGIVQGTIDYPRICYSLTPSALAPLQDLIAAIGAHRPEAEENCYIPPQGRSTDYPSR